MATVRPLTLGLRVAGERVHGDLERFPVRVDLTLPRDAREAPGAGLRVRDAAGELPHRLSADGAAGRIEGWIEARRLERGRDALLFLDLGADPADMEGFSDFALFGGRETDPRSPGDDFVVEGWLAADEVRAEAVQVIAAQWAFAEEVAGFATRDAGSTGGLRTRGFFGAVFDGRHVYFAPQCNDEGRHGQALRYDTRRPFDDPSAWEGYDAGATEGLVTRGYYGAVFDGRYAYFAPGYHQETGADGRVLRYDTSDPFRDEASWAVYDAGATGGLNCANYDGALYDGRHVYFAPLSGGAVLRHDPRRPFDDPAAWEAFDPDRLPGSPFGMCVGAVFDGRWIYFTPYAHSTVVRYDSESHFGDPASWQAFEASGVGGLRTRGYDGAAFDGRFVYFIPFWEGEDPGLGFHARTLRYDTSRPFEDPASWQAGDGSDLAPPNPGGFNGGAFDGRFLYMAPWREDDPSGEIRSHGQVLRLDTAAAGARFQLRWMDCGHNGGLGGSLPGASFLVNCAGGPVSVRAHRLPQPGWHHVAGVYRAERGAELWIDGELVDEAPSRGTPVEAAAPLTWGACPAAREGWRASSRTPGSGWGPFPRAGCGPRGRTCATHGPSSGWRGSPGRRQASRPSRSYPAGSTKAGGPVQRCRRRSTGSKSTAKSVCRPSSPCWQMAPAAERSARIRSIPAPSRARRRALSRRLRPLASMAGLWAGFRRAKSASRT